MAEPAGGGGWLAEHWDGIIGGGAAGVMLLRELYRLWTDRAKIAADTARDHRAEGEGLVSQALAMVKELQARDDRSQKEIEARGARIDRLEAELEHAQEAHEALGRDVGRRGLAILAEELIDPLDALGVVLDAIPCALVVTRQHDGRFLFPNRTFCEILGASRADLISQSWRDRVVPSDLSATAAVEARALGEPVEIENGYRTGPNADGPVVRLHWWAARYTKGGVSIAYARPVPGPAGSGP